MLFSRNDFRCCPHSFSSLTRFLIAIGRLPEIILPSRFLEIKQETFISGQQQGTKQGADNAYSSVISVSSISCDEKLPLRPLPGSSLCRNEADIKEGNQGGISSNRWCIQRSDSPIQITAHAIPDNARLLSGPCLQASKRVMEATSEP